MPTKPKTPVTGNYNKALDAHLDLIEWLRTSYGEHWADWFQTTMAPVMKAVPGWVIAEALAKDLSQMQTVFVNKQMCDLIEHAALTMPDVPLQYENLFWKSAFVYFERPIDTLRPVTSYDADTLKTRAISWRTGLVLVVEHPEDPDDTVELKDWQVVYQVGDEPKDQVQGIQHQTYVDTANINLAEVELSPQERWERLHTHLFPYDMSGWACGTRWKTVPHGTTHKDSLNVDEGLSQQRKLLLAVNLIAAQHIALVSGARAARSTMRRVTRSTTPHVGEIVVITLRRPYIPPTDSDPDPDFEYSHRFVVRGHWRHQYYKATGEHHLIWIDPFIKGPEHKPLIIKDRIWNVAR